MKIYLFRHAQKSMDFSGNPDLTSTGHAQAAKVLEKVLAGKLPHPTKILASPRKRAQSTFQPLASHLGLPLATHTALLEQQPQENLRQFRARVQGLLESMEAEATEVIFLCTHYDWVIEAMAILPCDTDLMTSEFMQWDSCQYAGFSKVADDIYRFIELNRIEI